MKAKWITNLDTIDKRDPENQIKHGIWSLEFKT